LSKINSESEISTLLKLGLTLSKNCTTGMLKNNIQLKNMNYIKKLYGTKGIIFGHLAALCATLIAYERVFAFIQHFGTSRLGVLVEI
jgi:hypothetical protein